MSIVFRDGWCKKTPHPFGWGVILSCICNIGEESGVIVCRGFDPAFSAAVFDLNIHFSTGETAFQDLDFAAFFYGKDLFCAIGILECRKFLCSIECPGVFAIRIDGFISSVGAFSLKFSQSAYKNKYFHAHMRPFVFVIFLLSLSRSALPSPVDSLLYSWKSAGNRNDSFHLPTFWSFNCYRLWWNSFMDGSFSTW